MLTTYDAIRSLHLLEAAIADKDPEKQKQWLKDNEFNYGKVFLYYCLYFYFIVVIVIILLLLIYFITAKFFHHVCCLSGKLGVG